MKMPNLRFVFSVAALSLAAAWLSACSNTTAGTSDDPNQITASIKGVVEKGPFVKGTTVTLYELNPETFAQTGKTFTGTVDGDDGSFSLGKVELGSRYVLLDANGYYWNELYGLKTTNPLSLRAIAHVEKNNTLNINIGTHITHKRILALLDSGLAFDEAKAKAESEVVEAFFGEDSGMAFENASIFDNSKLLALSIIVLMVGPEPDVTEMIAGLSAGLSADLLIKLADNAAFQYNDYAYARKHMEERFPNANLGTFEEFIYRFWSDTYGLGECSKNTAGILDTVHAENSVNDGMVAICKETSDGSDVYLWRSATDLEQHTFNLEPVEDGRLIRSETDSTVAYVYDNGKWREANASEIFVGMGCIKSLDGTLVQKDGEGSKCNWIYCIEAVNGYRSDGSLVMPDSSGFICNLGNQPTWVAATIFDYTKDAFFNPDVEYGSVTDERDGRTYRTVNIAGMTWMAENLTYATNGADCKDSLSIGCVYEWYMVMNVAKNDSVVENTRGICMEGWHVPDTTEWKVLLNEYSLADLKSSVEWRDGSNKSGFSVVPFASYVNHGLVTINSIWLSYADFFASNYDVGTNIMGGGRFTYGYGASFDETEAVITSMVQKEKSVLRYTKGLLRCVKDSE
ncbi:MAG: hypothetical protein J5791_08690 [Fibrobacter sp.]|nr:hypothetical protein [Fibrobacter sp.]